MCDASLKSPREKQSSMLKHDQIPSSNEITFNSIELKYVITFEKLSRYANKGLQNKYLHDYSDLKKNPKKLH